MTDESTIDNRQSGIPSGLVTKEEAERLLSDYEDQSETVRLVRWSRGGPDGIEELYPAALRTVIALRDQLATKDAEIERLKERLDALQRTRAKNYIAEYNDMREENEWLRVIVDKLPKTADEVTLFPGVEVWAAFPEGVIRGVVSDCLSTPGNGRCCVAFDEEISLCKPGTEPRDDIRTKWSDPMTDFLYSTREAAIKKEHFPARD